MGNCICHQSLVQGVGQDQDSSATDKIFPSKTSCDACDNIAVKHINEEEILGDKSGIKASTTEVKIKITKKQLEQLLSRVDIKELSVQQVLAQLMNVSDRYETQHRSWRPALQSIPE